MKLGDIMRIFIGIPLSESFSNDVRKKQMEIKPFVQKGKFTDPDNLHLTLLFIGEMDLNHIEHLNKHLCHDLAKEQKFSLTTSFLDSFKKNDEHILWIGIDEGQKEIEHLAKKINESTKRADISFRPSPFIPHITIARQVLFDPNFKFNDQDFQSHTILIDRIHLYQSHQVDGKLTYTPIYTYRLH